VYNLKDRTKAFSIEIIKLIQAIPYNRSSSVLCRQLLRSGTAIGANYRSALRARSKADFISKLAIAEEEADESCYWLELLKVTTNEFKSEIELLLNEANQLTAIITKSSITAKSKKSSS
jgi:four helix bundle protein